MTIKYKFNKSSEARDCVVESVELSILSLWNTEIKILSNEEIIEVLLNEDPDNDSDFKSKIDKAKSIDNAVCNLLGYIDYDFEQEDYDLYKSYETGIGWLELTNSEAEISFDLEQGAFGRKVTNVKGELTKSKIIKEAETKQFTSPQQLKDYINTIQEPIEFIAESSIDDVLMKEWIGEWETSYNCEECNNRNLGYWNDCDYNLCGKKEVKTGSPKLNSNWTFKIE